MCSLDQRRNRVCPHSGIRSAPRQPRAFFAPPRPTLPFHARAHPCQPVSAFRRSAGDYPPEPLPRAGVPGPAIPTAPGAREERPQNRKKANVRPKHHRRHRTSASAGEAGHGRPGGAGRQSERRGPASWMCSSVLERYTTGAEQRRERLDAAFCQNLPPDSLAPAHTADTARATSLRPFEGRSGRSGIGAPRLSPRSNA